MREHGAGDARRFGVVFLSNFRIGLGLSTVRVHTDVLWPLIVRVQLDHWLHALCVCPM